MLVLAVLALAACSAPDGQPRSPLEVRPAGSSRYSLFLDGEPAGVVQVNHVDLDTVEGEHHPLGGAVVTVHHGQEGSASLRLIGADRVLLTAEHGLSAPRWSPAGDVVAVVRRSPPVLTRASLRKRGALLLLDPRSGTHQVVAGIDDADRVLGWDREGRLLFTRVASAERSAERLARLDRESGEVVELLPSRDTFIYDLRVHEYEDRISYVRAAAPLSTLPAPDQRVELVLAELGGRPLRVVPIEGALPTRVSLRGDRLSFALDGTPEERVLDLASGAVQRRWLRRAVSFVPPPREALLSTLKMPYVHQVYDTPNSFNGNWACGPTSTVMAIQHFGRLKKWPITVDVPKPHQSDYGAYVAKKYTAYGTTFDRKQNDASGKPAQGAYGWCTEGGAAWAWRMQDYAKKHDLKSDFSGSVSFTKVKSAIAAGKVVVLSTQLTSAGHLITVKGTSSTTKLVVNDPYGDRNLPSYPNTKGEDASYTWSQVKAKWLITVYGKPSEPAVSYKAKLGDKSYPAEMVSGSTAEAWVEYKNDGAKSWSISKTHLGTTEPRDRASPFHTAGSWLAVNRPAAAGKAAQPGESARFTFTLTAPKVCKETAYKEAFNLVQEGEAWFSDSGQGGPKDTELVLTIRVIPGGGCDGGGGESDSRPHGGRLDGGPTLPDSGTRGLTDLHGGCSINRGGERPSHSFGLSLVWVLLLFRRRA
jgi:hypothetical protein